MASTMRTLLDTPVLSTAAPPADAPRLSKSKLVAALQCERRLWLEVHRPELVVIDAARQAVFDTGRHVGEVAGELAKLEWGVAELIDVKPPLGWEGGWQRCRERLDEAKATKSRAVLLEAPFLGPDFAVIADIVIVHPNGELWLVEVKSSTSIEGMPYIDDAAFQAHAMARCGYPPDRVFIRVIDNSFVYPGGGAYRGLFRDVEVTEKVWERLPMVDGFVARSRAVAGGEEPAVRPGAHCAKPYDCGFREHCDAWLFQLEGPLPEYPIELLAKRNMGRLSALERNRIAQRGWLDVRELSPDALADTRSRTLAEAIRSGTPWVAPGLRHALASLPYPRYHFDFETINPAVPLWAGTRPYQQVPFQWSCHVEHADGRLEHHMFLDVTGADPRRACAERIAQLMGGIGGCVLVYHQAFEEGRLRELARDLPDLAPALTRVIEKLRDLLPIVREHYYHPAQHGSYSLKAVLPTVVPTLDYGALDEVRDGAAAQRAYLEAIDPVTTPERREQLRERLERYCELDTRAMVEMVRVLS